jgi:hypothetical protein
MQRLWDEGNQMKWYVYKIVLSLKSPLHVGFHKVGNIQRTRYYVPGKNLWAAVTQKLTQCLHSTNFIDTGNFVRECITFGYFYPSINPDDPLYPQYTEEGLIYGKDTSAIELEQNIISSIVSTALVHKSTSAEKESLHEIEFISPFWKKTRQQIYLIGHVFAKEHKALILSDVDIIIKGQALFGSLLKEIQIGGERCYGFGKIALESNSNCTHRTKDIFGYRIECTSQCPTVYVDQRQHLLAHTFVSAAKNIRGQIEPLLGREWTLGGGAGSNLTRANICWVPGSIVYENEESVFQIGPYGIWQSTEV